MSSRNKTLKRSAIIGVFVVLGLAVGGTSTYLAWSSTAEKQAHPVPRAAESNSPSAPPSASPSAPSATVVPRAGQKPPVAFADGLYKVGEDIKPGEYKTDGPGPGGACYWARLGDSGGATVIANDLSEGPTHLTAVKGEYLEVSGCSFVRA